MSTSSPVAAPGPSLVGPAAATEPGAPGQSEPDPPLLRVVRGEPTETELAAMTLVFALLAVRGREEGEEGSGRKPARWHRPDRNRTPVSWASGSHSGY
ncbi:hypothetical protein AQ490_05190 [Wenjunlia vitaminophila]|uniref:Uncharacterized protein n=1 Tax=Wenjunlia vitaminophila TaxID=76728 RepID=A0A0T6LNU7_WENVI|nr:acyl-CoA carboxylase subunit epsilon [Wenjunlia vitaminophila]KRV47770.1 hypothetical protein AQ490_05190 [Wenjunlia vitaminophila]